MIPGRAAVCSVVIGSLLLAALIFVLGAAASGARAQAQPDGPVLPPIADAFSGEWLSYDISVLFFRRAAEARIVLAPAPAQGSGAHRASGGTAAAASGWYVARASVETKGFVGWLQRRRHVYTSVLEPCDGGSRWCSRRFVMDLAGRDHREVRTTVVDPARRVITWAIERDGVLQEVGEEPMRPGGRYDDLLPRDAIPAVLDPKPLLVPARSARGIRDDARVIGVALRGEARAYPIVFLSWHEIVNDVVGGRPIAATW